MNDANLRDGLAKGTDTGTRVEFHSESAIRRKTSLEALQEPTTLLPLGVCIASGVYTMLLAPMVGGTVLGIAVIAGCGAAATVSYVSHYRRRYSRHVTEATRDMDEQYVRAEQAELDAQCELLRLGFAEVDDPEALHILTGLMAWYQRLCPPIRSRRSIDPLYMSLVPALAAEIFKSGLSALSYALELTRMTRTAKTDPYGEVSQTTKDDKGPGASQIEVADFRLGERWQASERARQAMLGKVHLQIEHLLQEAHRCEIALERAQVELTSVRMSGNGNNANAAIHALQRTISQVKEVQDEFDQMNK